MNSFLPNIRWLTLLSDGDGSDWYAKSLEIDSVLSGEGMDLATEATYLLFSETPEDILNGKGHCLIARSVIGPKKSFNSPFSLIDWVASPVWKESLKAETLPEILTMSEEVRRKASMTFANPFFLCVRRKLCPELEISVEVIFHQ